MREYNISAISLKLSLFLKIYLKYKIHMFSAFNMRKGTTHKLKLFGENKLLEMKSKQNIQDRKFEKNEQDISAITPKVSVRNFLILCF